MNYRLREGHGEAFYILGVHDDGRVVGLPDDELIQSIALIRYMAKVNHAEASVLRLLQGTEGKMAQLSGTSLK